MLTLAEAVRFLDDSRSMGRVPWMKAFRRYVRDEWPPRRPSRERRGSILSGRTAPGSGAHRRNRLLTPLL